MADRGRPVDAGIPPPAVPGPEQEGLFPLTRERSGVRGASSGTPVTPQPPRPANSLDSDAGTIPVRWGWDGPVIGTASVEQDESGLRAAMTLPGTTLDRPVSMSFLPQPEPESPAWLREHGEEPMAVRWAPGSRPGG